MANFNWTTNTLSPNLKRFPERIDRAMTGVMSYHRSRAEGYAKRNAPWTDRTGNARNGLRAITARIPYQQYQIILFHQVPYGIWLELAHSGKYRIIWPTVLHEAPAAMATVQTLFSRIGSGS